MPITYDTNFESSNIHGLAYADGKCFVEFNGFTRFAYAIPKALFDELRAAKSIGTFFARNIKGKYPVAWRGWRCDLSPCQADASLEGSVVSSAAKFRVCAACARIGTLANVTLTPIGEENQCDQP